MHACCTNTTIAHARTSFSTLLANKSFARKLQKPSHKLMQNQQKVCTFNYKPENFCSGLLAISETPAHFLISYVLSIPQIQHQKHSEKTVTDTPASRKKFKTNKSTTKQLIVETVN